MPEYGHSQFLDFLLGIRKTQIGQLEYRSEIYQQAVMASQQITKRHSGTTYSSWATLLVS